MKNLTLNKNVASVHSSSFKTKKVKIVLTNLSDFCRDFISSYSKSFNCFGNKFLCGTYFDREDVTE